MATMSRLEKQIRAAYAELDKKQGGTRRGPTWVRLADLWVKLWQAPDKQLKDFLIDMSTRDRHVHLAPSSDRRALTNNDRLAAVRIGSEDKHLILIERD